MIKNTGRVIAGSMLIGDRKKVGRCGDPTTVEGRSWAVFPDRSFMLESVLMTRDGYATVELVSRHARTVYPNGDIVTVMELA